MLDLGSAVGYLLLDTKGFESGFKSAMSGFKTFSDKSKSFSDKMTGLGKGLTTVGSAMSVGLTVPILGAGAAAVYAANDFETALKSIESNTGSTKDEMKKFESVLDSVFKNNYGENYQDIADSISEVDKQLKNLSDKELQEVTESALAFRDAFGYEVNESVRAANALMKNFGKTSEEAYDLLVKGMQNGLDFSGEFIDSISEYSVQFKKLGFSAEEMFYVFEQGAESGAWNLDKVGDAMKELSIRVIDGSESTELGFKTIGLSSDEMAAKFAKGGESAKQALKETVDALLGLEDPLEQNTAGVSLFGTMWEDLGPDVVKQMSDITNATYDAKGAMDELKDTRYDTLGSDFESLKRELVSLGKELGLIVIPILRDIVDWVSGVVEAFSKMPESMQGIVVVALGVVAALGPLMTLLGSLLTVIPQITALIAGAGGLSAVLSSLVAPIGLVIAAIAVLATAWVTNFGGIRDKTVEIFESISNIVSTVLGFLKKLWDDNFLGIRSIVENAFKAIESIFSNALDVIVAIFDVFEKAFTGDWDGLWKALGNLLNEFMGFCLSVIGNILNFIIDSAISFGVSFLKAIDDIFKNAVDVIGKLFVSFMDWWNRVLQDPVQAIYDIGQAFYRAGESIINSLGEGLKNAFNSVVDWINGAIDWVVSKVAFWQSESNKVGYSPGKKLHAQGIDYVPYDGYQAVLHRGERVLTQEEVKNGIGTGIKGNVTIEIPLIVNGRQFAKATAKDINKELAKL